MAEKVIRTKRMGITVSDATFERLVLDAGKLGVPPSTYVVMLVNQSLNQQGAMDTMNRFFDLIDKLPEGALKSGRLPAEFESDVKKLKGLYDENLV